MTIGGLIGAYARLTAGLVAAALAASLAACGQDNRYVAPPPPKVTVALPVQQTITRYLEATGNAAAVNSTNLVARVQGFLQQINYKDGDLVKQGTALFVIEPEPYKLKLEQAQAAEAGAQATLKQAEAEYERQADLASRQVASKAALDNATANRDLALAKLTQAQVDTKQAAINLGYTQVKAPFDGIVTARLVSLGELVGANGPTQLATIVETDPIYVSYHAGAVARRQLRYGQAAEHHRCDRGQRQEPIAIQLVLASFRANVPQLTVEVDRVKTETLGVSLDQVFAALSGYLGSSYVDQFNKFGRVFQIYVQTDSQFRLRPDDIQHLSVRNKRGDMIPLGTLVTMTPSVGPALISLFNLRPSATIIGLPADGVSSGEVLTLMEEIARRTLPPGTGFEWSSMSYQEKLVGYQMYIVFGLALLLVYLVLAGQYESWYAPISVILAVPLSFIGPVAALTGSGLNNNLYVQIGLVLLMALSAKNAILNVELARELRAEGNEILEAAIEAARARFRPILMTSFAFILGVVPLVLASGAGASASARMSIGITVFTGMIASTCLAVLFVPSFFVVVQGFEEWRKEGKTPGKTATLAGTPG